MTSSHDDEDKRLILQAELDAGKSKHDRNRLGQFATPTALARELLAHAMTLLPAGESIRFFDPAIGTGSFYSALRAVAKGRKVSVAAGFEIDPHYGTPAQTFWAHTPLKITLADFTRAPLPSPRARANLLVCNPPYVRHHHLNAADKAFLQQATRDATGVELSGLAGLYCHFLLLSHGWMQDDGLACWLIPSEFMDVNYGRVVKSFLLDKVTLLRIHRFDPNDVQFDDALVSSAVVWFRNVPPPAGHSVSFTYGGTHAAPRLSRQVDVDLLQQSQKWTRFPQEEAQLRTNELRLADLFDIKRGIATGSNDFFILTRERIQELGLPIGQFRPILPSPRYLPVDQIDAEPNGDPRIDRRYYLLDCRLTELQIRDRFPALWKYLQSGRPAMEQRYLCKARALWYLQESRAPSPFICTYMGRSDGRSGKPFRFLLNRSRAIVANTYLNLYPRPPVARRLAEQPALLDKVWAALNEITPASMVAEGRVYGGGLHKMEPKELAQVPAGKLANLLGLGRDSGLFDVTA